MEKTYWLERKRASVKMAESARCSAARLAHYDLAGRYSVNAAAAGAQMVALADSLPPPIYAGGSNAPFEDGSDA